MPNPFREKNVPAALTSNPIIRRYGQNPILTADNHDIRITG